jgi:hypothetical protein
MPIGRAAVRSNAAFARQTFPMRGDWSAVKVWFGPIGDLGMRVNPVAGFIYPDVPREIVAPRVRIARAPLIGKDVIQLAMLELSANR